MITPFLKQALCLYSFRQLGGKSEFLFDFFLLTGYFEPELARATGYFSVMTD